MMEPQLSDDILGEAIQSANMFEQQNSYIPVYQPTYQPTYSVPSMPMQQQQHQQSQQMTLLGQAILKELKEIHTTTGEAVLKELKEINSNIVKLQNRMKEVECGIKLKTDTLVVPVSFIEEKTSEKKNEATPKRIHEIGLGAHSKSIKKQKK